MADASSVLAGESLPATVGDGVQKVARGGRRGETMALSLVPTKHLLAAEGSFFTATNPTPGTGISTNAVETSFSDTRGFFVMGNLDAAGGKTIYLDYLRLILLATAPTATVSLHFAIKKSVVTREPTTAANRTILTPAPAKTGSSSIARPMSYANAGAMTVPASAVSDPILARLCVPTGLGIAGDEYVLFFGGPNGVDSSRGGAAVRATDPGRVVAHGPPIAIAPGEWVVIHRWWLTEATNGPNFEFELAWWER